MIRYRGIPSVRGATRQWWLKCVEHHLLYPSPRNVLDDPDDDPTGDFPFLVKRGAIPSGLPGRVVVRLSHREDDILLQILGVS